MLTVIFNHLREEVSLALRSLEARGPGGLLFGQGARAFCRGPADGPRDLYESLVNETWYIDRVAGNVVSAVMATTGDRGMKQRHFSAGETIFSEGDSSREAYLIHSGRVEILKDSPRGPLRLAVLGAGDILGEMGLLEERPRSATARALDPVLTSAVETDEFLRLILDEPEEALDLLRALFERLRMMSQNLADLGVAPEPSGPAESARELPRVVINPLTPETERDVAGGGLTVTRFPFRIGRHADSREEMVLAFNDIELNDEKPYQVSLNHFALDLSGPGLVVRDRGSLRGTMVNGKRIGPGAEHDHAPLRSGDNEVVSWGPCRRPRARRRAGTASGSSSGRHRAAAR